MNDLNTRLLRLGLTVTLLTAGTPGLAHAQDDAPGGPTAANTWVYLPALSNRASTGTVSNYPPLPRAVNVPYVVDLIGPQGNIQKLPEMSIFWFGQVQDNQNYTDVRIAASDTQLVVYVASFDRHAWYDTTPSTADLTAWDGATLYLNTAGLAGGLSGSSYRFTAQLNNGETVSNAGKLSERGTGGAWATANVPFEAFAAWRGQNVNDADDDRGWVITFRIPFASLGLSRPADGSAPWALAVVAHDRDNAGVQPDTYWPETFRSTDASAWGGLRWGQPTYTPPPSAAGGTVMVREGLNGATVPDADIGGVAANQCSGDTNFLWSGWGNSNYGAEANINIQNQSDVADWPCFAKTYLTFPLTQVPAGRVIRSATLQLHQFGGSGTASNGQPGADAYVQVFRIGADWNESTLTWNNAPMPIENHGGAWVGQVVGCGAPGGIPWPCVQRDWDVTRLVAEAYAAGEPARLALYSADSDYSTGKYFTASESGDWNQTGRPALVIEWGNP